MRRAQTSRMLSDERSISRRPTGSDISRHDAGRISRVKEANRAQSHDDFIHKIAICEKEAAETEYWLELLDESGIAGKGTCNDLLLESRELLAIFVASGRTAKSRR